MSVEEKIDRILEILEKRSEAADVKKKIIAYMMEHYNISFINDTIEENVYETLLDIIFSLLQKHGLFN